MTPTDTQLRLWAAKVLDEGKNCHKWEIEPRSMDIRLDFKSQVLHGQCEKCGLKHSGDEYSEGWGRNDCPHLDLPKDKLEVLAEKCKAKCGSLEYTKALFEQLGCDFNRRGDMELIAVAWAATSADKIIAAAKARGIDI